MEEEVCFPLPINACFSLGCSDDPLPTEPDDEGLTELKEIASNDCYLCKFDDLTGEDWD